MRRPRGTGTRPVFHPLLLLPLLTAFLLALLLALAFWMPRGHSQETDAGGDRALLLTWQGAIGPASADYLARGLARAQEEGYGLVILRLDTHGGLDSSMRQMIQGILASPVPLVTWVWPRGARAASAGTYILYASQIAAMTPGTTLGAATPVQLGGSLSLRPAQAAPAAEDAAPEADKDREREHSRPQEGEPERDKSESDEDRPDDARSAKALEDAVAYIRGLAELHGRNADWAEEAVRRAASLPASEALAEGVIDLIASDLEALLAELDGRRVVMAGGRSEELATLGMRVVASPPDWRARFLAIISDPNLALILMMIGIYGLIFEFSNPGALYPGTFGAISLLLGLFSLSILPLDYAGLALLLLGVALMTAEAFLPSFGALGLGGLAAFVLGAAMLFDEVDAPGFALSWWTIGALAALSLLFLVLLLRLALRSYRRPVTSGPEELLGSRGRVLRWRRKAGRVRLHGEVWQARAAAPLAPGQAVRVTGRDGLVLEVEPAPPETALPKEGPAQAPPSGESYPSKRGYPSREATPREE